MAGHTGELRSRSLLTSHEDAVTLIFKGVPGVEIRTPSYVWAYLKKGLSDEVLCLLPPSLPLSLHQVGLHRSRSTWRRLRGS